MDSPMNTPLAPHMDPKRSFQALILTLHAYWADKGCAVLQPYDMEVGAGTFHPATTLRALGPKPWKAAYVQPSRRPGDGRYGEAAGLRRGERAADAGAPYSGGVSDPRRTASMARLTANLLRPVPVADIEVRVQEDYVGRNAGHFSAVALADGKELIRATALFQREGEVDLPQGLPGRLNIVVTRQND
eukprot:gene31703-35790_t